MPGMRHTNLAELSVRRKNKMELKKASENRRTFENLFNMYCYELSFDDPWLGTNISVNGDFNPPEGLDAMVNGSYVIYEEDHAIGFVTYEEGNMADYSIAEIFITNSFRRKGIASEIVQNYLKDKEGTFMVHILKNSKAGNAFFQYIFNKNNLTYERKPMDEIADAYYVNLKKI